MSVSWDTVSELSKAKTMIDSELVIRADKPFTHDEPFEDFDLSGYKSILDFGAGIGRYIPEILRRKDKDACVFAYDFPNMRKLAIEHLGESVMNEIFWLCPPIDSLCAFKFDLVIASVVFQHINPKELARILSIINDRMTHDGILWAYSRGYSDYSVFGVLPSVLSMVNDYFVPISEVDLNDDSERHQIVLFRRRISPVKGINPLHWSNLDLNSSFFVTLARVSRRLQRQVKKI